MDILPFAAPYSFCGPSGIDQHDAPCRMVAEFALTGAALSMAHRVCRHLGLLACALVDGHQVVKAVLLRIVGHRLSPAAG